MGGEMVCPRGVPSRTKSLVVVVMDFIFSGCLVWWIKMQIIKLLLFLPENSLWAKEKSVRVDGYFTLLLD